MFAQGKSGAAKGDAKSRKAVKTTASRRKLAKKKTSHSKSKRKSRARTRSGNKSALARRKQAPSAAAATPSIFQRTPLPKVTPTTTSGAAASDAPPATQTRVSASDAAAGAQPGTRVGMASHLVWVSENEAYQQLQTLRAGGVRTIREDFDWALTEPSPGRFDWARLDRIVAAGARAGVNVLGIVDYSAGWASSDPSPAKSKFYLPEDPADYATYAAAVARRYAPGGPFWASRPDLPVVPLAGLEIWNEPYGNWYFKPTPSASVYATLTRLAASAIHEADPAVPVVASGNLMLKATNGTRGPWLSAVLDAEPSLANLVDAWAIHPYETARQLGPDGGPKEDDAFGFASIPAAHALLQSRGIASPIWVTEIGWSTALGTSDAVSERQQASFMARALQRTLGDWGSYVKRAYLFSWDVASGEAGDWSGNVGLRRADGSAKTAWQAIRSFTSTSPFA